MTDERVSELSEALARGRKAAERLGSATDQLTETIAKIERALEDLHFGVNASIELAEGRYEEDEDDPIFEPTLRLSFRKTAKRWTLMVATATDPSDDEWTVSPLVNASREVRLLAVEKLPELIDAMVKEAEWRLKEVETAQQRADAVLGTLTEVQAPAKPVATAIASSTAITLGKALKP